MDDPRDKIAKLLSLSESSVEVEAEAALLQARALMAKYKLREEECQRKEDRKSEVIRRTLNISCTSLTDPWLERLAY